MRTASSEVYSAEELNKRIASTYLWLRLGMGIMALVLPILLWVGGKVLGDLSLQGSMSAYYHGSIESHKPPYDPAAGVMRDWFVGFLFAIGIMLFLYHGFTLIEDVMLNFAGFFLILVALFPMSWPEIPPKPLPYTFSGATIPIIGVGVHGACAVIFFFCIGYVCFFHGDDTLQLTEEKYGLPAYQKYRRAYKILGFGIIAFPILAALLTLVVVPRYLVFGVEWAGIWVFAIYWLVKSWEIYKTNADQEAAKGNLEIAKAEKSSAGVNPVQQAPGAAPDAPLQKVAPANDNVSVQDQLRGKVTVRKKMSYLTQVATNGPADGPADESAASGA